MKKLVLTALTVMMLGSSLTVHAACSHTNLTTTYDHRLSTFTTQHIHEKVIYISGKPVVQTYPCTITKERAVYKLTCNNCGTVAYDVRENVLSHSVK